MQTDFNAINVGSMKLIGRADVDEELVYQLTKAIGGIGEKSRKLDGAGLSINEGNAARFTALVSPGSDSLLQRDRDLESRSNVPRGGGSVA